MTLFFYILIGVITFVAFLHAWSKKEYDIYRTLIINNPKAEVYGYVRQLKNQKYWIPWFGENPQLVLKLKGEDGKPGAALYWNGKSKFGEEEGVQKIVKVKQGKVFESQLMFVKPYKTLSLSYIGVKEVSEDRTKIVWGLRGVHRFPASVVMLFYGLERVVGKDLEEGLSNLKSILENK